MPRLNISGDWCAGIGGGVVSVNGQIIATSAGGACWMDPRRVVYQNCSGGVCRVESYNYLNAEVQTIFAHGANHIEAGGGLCAAWFGTLDTNQAGITFSDGRRFPSSGLGPVGPDGAVTIKDEYQSAGPWSVVEPDGSRWQLTPADAGNINLMGQRRAVWTDWRGLVSVNMPAPKVITSTFWWLRVLEVEGVWWALYQAEDGRLVLHPFDSTKGYVIAQGNTFRPDVCYLHGIGFRVVWALSEGEPPQDVRVRDVDPLTEPLIELVPPVVAPLPQPPTPQTPEPTPMALGITDDQFNTLVRIRAKYGETLDEAQIGALLNEVAWIHRAEGVGMQRKDGGTNATQPRTGIKVWRGMRFAGDIGQDVLGAASIGKCVPVRGFADKADPNTFVAPVEPIGAPAPDPEPVPQPIPNPPPATDLEARVHLLEQTVSRILTVMHAV